MSVLLSIQKLQATVDDIPILKGITLDIKKGETVVLMGPNGSGKSTMAKVLAGHPEYTAKGSVKLLKKELLDLSPDERSQQGLFLAFQYPVEIPGVKVLNFLWTVYTQKYPKRSERKYSSIVDFKNYLEARAQELDISPELLMRGLNEDFSGGEKKRLEILQMAVLEPKVAILDETDSGLDIDAVRVVAKGVSQIQKETGMALVVITHYKRILEYIDYDTVHIMVQGKIVKSGGSDLVEELEQRGYGEIRG